MKKIPFAALLALTGVGLVAQTAHAASPTYTSDDLFLGFRQDGNSTDILIDLGQAQQYRDDTTTGSLNSIIGSGLGSLLNSTFGTGWQTADSTVHWAVFGTPGLTNKTTTGSVTLDAGKSLYLVNPENPKGTLATGPTANTSSTQATAVNNILTMKNAWVLLTDATGLNNGALENGASTAGSSTYGGQALNDFGDATQFAGFEGSFGSGAAGAALDLFRMTPTDSSFLSTAGPADGLRGTFTISSSGTVSYNAAVPEPTTITLLGGAGLLVLMRRRRTSVA